MSENINIVARRIFNRLDEDIEDRIGLKDEWVQISPQIKNDGIRRTWEQIFTEEIEKHTTELQARVKRLEEALVAADKYIDEIQADDNGDYHTWVVNVADARTAYNFAKQTAKESKP